MKVLFINTVYGKGSTGRIIKEIGQMLLEKGHDYVAAYGRGPEANDGHGYRIGGKWSVYAHALLSRLTDKAGFYSKKATKELVTFISEYNPDVIHLHNLHGYYINLEVLFNYLKQDYKGKVVWTLHDCWAFTGHCTHYTYAKCDKWKTGCHHCPEKKRYPASLLLDSSKRNYLEKHKLFTGLKNLSVIAPSNWIMRQIKQSFLKEYPCYEINNGIDLMAFSPQDLEKDPKLLINIADGLDERKGFGDLVRLMELLPTDYRMVIVGVRKKDLSKIPPVITPVLRTNSVAELAAYYSRAGWFVNTTYEDTFPTVNIEALACGTPVITYRSGGSPEIPDEHSGIVVEPGDVVSIANFITTHEGFRPEACVKRVHNYDKWDKFGEYVALYGALMKES